MGNSVEDCRAFKAKVQKLIDDKSLVFKEDHPKVRCEYYTGTMGHSIEECMGFRIKIQRLIDTKLSALKQENSNAYALIPKTCYEKNKGSLKPLEIMYHKEDIKQLAMGISPFLCENVEVMPRSYNITTHASGSIEEMGNGSE